MKKYHQPISKNSEIARKAHEARDLAKDNRFPQMTRQALDDAGNLQIASYTIFRDPIRGSLDTLLEVLTLKTWEDAKKAAHYDKFFHLFIIFELIDGRLIIAEKNANIIIRPNYKNIKDIGIDYTGKMGPYGGPSGSNRIPKGYTINRMLMNYRDNIPGMFTYSAFRNNCQDFCYNLLNVNGLANQEMHDFIMQDVEAVCKKLPFFIDKMSRLMTDLASYIGHKWDDYGLAKIYDVKLKDGGFV